MNDFTTDGVSLFKRLAAINRTITTSLSFEDALGLIAGSGLELAGGASCLVLLREEEGGLRICAAQGVDSETAARWSGPMEEAVLEKLRQDLGFARSKNIAAFPVMSDQSRRAFWSSSATPRPPWTLHFCPPWPTRRPSPGQRPSL
jgi:hypothetical protein